MASSNLKIGSLIVQLHNQTNELKEAFDQALAELERQKAENEKQYQKQLEQLKEERRQWDEEKAIMGKLPTSTSSIVHLNVGGEKMSTSRATLTLVEGSLLAIMFSGKWEDNLMKDTNACIFLDYDPILFKCLLNQLRTWSNPSIKRIFHLPVGSEESFLEFVRSLQFDERFIDGETITVTSPHNVVQPEQGFERFRTSPDVRLTDNDRRCEKISQKDGWQCVFGILNYSTGIHRIRLKLEKGIMNMLIGICSQNEPPKGSPFYNKPTTHGWFTHDYVVTNGHGSSTIWPPVKENDILELTINCDEKSLSILNERSQAQNSIQVDINQAPFPWCLLVIHYSQDNQISLV